MGESKIMKLIKIKNNLINLETIIQIRCEGNELCFSYASGCIRINLASPEEAGTIFCSLVDLMNDEECGLGLNGNIEEF